MVSKRLLAELESEGLVSFEEIDCFEEIQGDTAHGGKILKPVESSQGRPKEKCKKSRVKKEKIRAPFTCEESLEELENWKEFALSAPVRQVLSEVKFESPTPIQTQVLNALKEEPLADIIGCAPTGSGKTLAFGLPIIEAYSKDPSDSLIALIIVPTRELGLQVTKSIKELGKYTSVQVVAIIGGLAEQKQERLLNRNPNIIVATPGRLWEYVSENAGDLQAKLSSIKFLVFDEVDRMLERGHFRETTQILSRIYSPISEEFQCEWEGVEQGNLHIPQTFLFSATAYQGKSEGAIFREFKKVIKFQGTPRYLRIETESGLADNLDQSRIFCLKSEKDFYLYYFLLKHPGRTLIFVNSIDCARRLHPILTLLELKSVVINGQMEQKQRLKNLDKFRERPDSILIATDVAARGIDIPEVNYVIHYQFPNNKQTYIHRSGRTARASKAGLSLALVSEDDMKNYQLICKSLSLPQGLDEFPIEMSVLDKIKKRVIIARQIDEQEHSVRKDRVDGAFEKKALDTFGIDSEEPIPKESDKKFMFQLKKQKEILKKLISEPVVPAGISLKYPTNCSENLLSRISKSGSAVNPNILGDPMISAIELLKKRKKQ